MALLERTQAALGELSASQQYDLGTHAALQIKAGVPGVDVGEVPFDPVKHPVSAISPFSLMEHATGVHHVKMVIPHRPLETSIVVHRDSQSKDDPRIVNFRNTLASALQASLYDSLPGMTDRALDYELTESEADVTSGAEVLTVDCQEPLAATEAVAELCMNGLTFVISDFKRLPLYEIEADYSSTVAIKVNHVAEMPLPSDMGMGIISLGGAKEVNTDKPKELAKFNADLEGRHQRIIERLRSAGIAVAQVVYNPAQHQAFGFDVKEADQQIAAAVATREA